MATLRKKKNVNPATGRTPHKKAVKVSPANYILSAPKGAFSEAQVVQLKADFAAAGINVIWMLFSNNSPSIPRFDRLY